MDKGAKNHIDVRASWVVLRYLSVEECSAIKGFMVNAVSPPIRTHIIVRALKWGGRIGWSAIGATDQLINEPAQIAPVVKRIDGIEILRSWLLIKWVGMFILLEQIAVIVSRIE